MLTDRIVRRRLADFRGIRAHVAVTSGEHGTSVTHDLARGELGLRVVMTRAAPRWRVPDDGAGSDRGRHFTLALRATRQQETRVFKVRAPALFIGTTHKRLLARSVYRVPHAELRLPELRFSRTNSPILIDRPRARPGSDRFTLIEDRRAKFVPAVERYSG